MRLLLVRHAESTGNAKRVLQGELDFGLSNRGREQSALLADRLARVRIDAIFSSSMRRAVETAKIVAAELGIDITKRADLVERKMGRLAGLTGPEIRERFPEYVQARREGRQHPIEGLEPDDALHQRVTTCLNAIISAHPGRCVAVVTHGGVIGTFTRSVLNIGPARPAAFGLDNTSVTTFDVGEGQVDVGTRRRIHLVSLNDTCHLDGLVSADAT
jgi:broad specificity phosphatase PhoE